MQINNTLSKNSIIETTDNNSKIIKKLLDYQIVPIIHYIIESPISFLNVIISKQILEFNKKDIKLENTLFSFFLTQFQKDKISEKQYLTQFIKILGNSLPLGIMRIYVYFSDN